MRNRLTLALMRGTRRQWAGLDTGWGHLIRGCDGLLTRATSRRTAGLQTYAPPRLQCVSVHAATAAVILALSLPLAAQGPVVTWTYFIYAPTLQEAIITQPMDPLFVRCDQDVPVVAPGTDPSMIVWDDPDRPGRVCVWVDPPPGPLRNIPPGMYLLSLVATVDGVDHPESTPRTQFVKKAAGGVVIIARNVRVL